jgi:hypothetical protein
MLARDGHMIAGDSQRVRFDALDTYLHRRADRQARRTHHPLHLRRRRRTVDRHVTRDRDLAESRMVDDMHGPKRALAHLARFDDAYLRFTGALDVEHHRGGALVDKHTNDAIWELMYFGHARS